MASTPMYHQGCRALQDAFDSRRLADRLDERLTRDAFSESQPLFFLATADANGWPEVSYKGGIPGFVQVADASTLIFPSYDGNGMFRSLGNLGVNPCVGLLFIDFEHPRRLRVQGRADLATPDTMPGRFPGAQSIVRVRVERIFPNCPRYIHPMRRLALSEYAPREAHTPPEPAWKGFEMFSDVLPRRG